MAFVELRREIYRSILKYSDNANFLPNSFKYTLRRRWVPKCYKFFVTPTKVFKIDNILRFMIHWSLLHSPRYIYIEYTKLR